jgi:hypothetical protein
MKLSMPLIKVIPFVGPGTALFVLFVIYLIFDVVFK